MILITGATGHFGKATIDSLLKKGEPTANIAALVRDENKGAALKGKGIDIRLGGYDNYNSLVKAFKNVEKLLLVSGTDQVNRTKQHENVINAAKAAGVKHILYTSFERKDEAPNSTLGIVATSHIDTEEKIKSSGLAYTILRNNIYADMIPIFVGEKVLETGIFFPAGDGKVGFATRADMAEATANILAGKGHENKEYHFSNPQALSFHDIAQAISSASGKNISYNSPPTELYIDTLTKAGVPREYAQVFAGFAEAFKQGELNTEKSDLERLLGRKLVSTRDFLKQVYAPK